MRFPKKLPIERMEEYHTHYLGKSRNGKRFWGYITFVYPAPYPEVKKDDWQKHRMEYAVLHLFDRWGNYLSSQSYCGGTAEECDHNELSSTLAKWVAALDPIKFCDIKVKLFETVIDGITFGLIPDDETGTIDLQPGSTISFQEPWDGSYYT